MQDLIVAHSPDAASPFDDIKRTREDGSEFWSARDLMPLLGYGDKWQNFESAINRAKTAAKVQGTDAETLFTGVSKKTSGRPQADYELARFAAYLVAMNGDPRKPEIAAAQAYFAVQTHVAEQAQQAPAIPQNYAEALRAAAEQYERAEAAELEAAQNAKRLELAAPKIAKADAHSEVKEWKRRQDFYREVQQYGDTHGLDIKQGAVRDLLTRKGMLIAGGRSDSGQITRQAVRSGWGRNHKGVADNGHAFTTPQLSPKGQDIAWKWIVKAIEEFGAELNPRKVA